ncbi:hypothetical protein TeGR_g5013, partial [Tetraparma gracilis]
MSPSHAAEITCTNEGEVPCVLSGMGDRQILAVSDIAFASLDTYTEADVAAANPGGEDGDEFRRERRAAAKHPRRRLSDSATPELIRLSYLTFAESRWPQAFSYLPGSALEIKNALVEIVSCTFRDNNVAGSSSVGNGKKGGSIYFEADYSTDPDYQYSLTIQASQVTPFADTPSGTCTEDPGEDQCMGGSAELLCAAKEGGAIYVKRGSASVEGSSFVRNRAVRGGAIFATAIDMICDSVRTVLEVTAYSETPYSQLCAACPEGSVGDVIESKSPADCTVCPSGKYQENSGVAGTVDESCTRCEAGKFLPDEGTATSEHDSP